MASTEFESTILVDENEIDVKVYAQYQPKEPDNGIEEDAVIEEVKAIIGFGPDQKFIDVPVVLFDDKTIGDWKDQTITMNRQKRQSFYYGA